MDKDSNSSGSALPTTGLIWLAMIAAGAVFVHQVPWQERRPAAQDLKPYRYDSEQTVDARLWQDPIGATKVGIDEENKRAGGRDTDPRGRHSPAAMARRIHDRACNAGVPVDVLGVMVPGAPYFEAVESRRRARYAVLAALNTKGYVPDDSDHLGFLRPPQANRLPEFIAYEWLTSRVPEADSAPVLALWLDESVFGTHTVERLTRLASAIAPPPCAGTGAQNLMRFNIIGPSSSGTLAGMLQFDRSGADASAFTFYAYGPTLPWSAFLGGSSDDQEKRLQLRGLNLFRTIGTDDHLATVLATELKRRQVDPANNCNVPVDRQEHVALIGEWDTFYGRALPDEMARLFACPKNDRIKPPWVHNYSYLRGLDGELPGTAQAGTAAAGGKDTKAAASSDKDRSKDIEKAEGQDQVDYLRRLSTNLREQDAQWRSQGGHGFRAIGVLGTDIYDKLLILQALRDQFPDAIFFTTDLDARMLHPQEQAWTRNLIVASHFGLQLHPQLQRDIPPFRDAYQSSIFFSTLVALHDMQSSCAMEWECIDRPKLSGWLGSPRIFEIGKTRAFDYGAAVGAGDCADAQHLIACRSIHASGSAMYPSPSAAVLRGVMILVLGIALLVGLAYGKVQSWCRTLIGGDDASAGDVWFMRFMVVVWGAILVVVARNANVLWAVVIGKLTEHGLGEPLSFTEGISVWPSELIRLTAAVVAWTFIVTSWNRMKDNLDEISEHMRFPPWREVVERFVSEQVVAWPLRKRLLRRFSFRLDEVGGDIDPLTGSGKDARYFWQKYLYQAKGTSRALRTAGAVVLYFAVSVVVVSSFGQPTTPSRGAVSGLMNFIALGLAVLSMLTLIFFIVDATVLSAQFIRALKFPMRSHDVKTASVMAPQATRTFWPQATLAHYEALTDVPRRYLDPWITMDFIAMRTRVISNLIYFPFIVISLMIVSRSRFFDKWNMPLGLLIVFATSVLIIIFCGAALRETAEAARKQAVRCLSDDIVRLRAGTDAERRTGTQLELMVSRIQALREGAFASYTQQPLFKALVLSLGSFGGTALLDYLTVASF